jgi:membrane-bound lytic murein transglycosylase B
MTPQSGRGRHRASRAHARHRRGTRPWSAPTVVVSVAALLGAAYGADGHSGHRLGPGLTRMTGAHHHAPPPTSFPATPRIVPIDRPTPAATSSRPWAAAGPAARPRPVLPAASGAVDLPSDLRPATSSIPAAAVSAYRAAAVTVAAEGCTLDWQLLAAVGYVESGHGRDGDHRLDGLAVVHPAEFGPTLDGHAGVAFLDSDSGTLDGNLRWDRGVGPLRLLPTTWTAYGAGRGRPQVQSLRASAETAARYLCAAGAGTGDRQLRAALLTYRGSAAYRRAVLTVAAAYRTGSSGLAR